MMITGGAATGWKAAAAGLLLVFAAWRLFSPDRADEAPRETLRVLVCHHCRELSFVEGEFIEQQYREGNVRPSGPDGMLFGCPSCSTIKAYFRDVDLIAEHIVCRTCGGEGPNQAEAVAGMIAQHLAKAGRNGRMTFWCGGCEAFSAVLNRRELPHPSVEGVN